jgi:glycine dehydrogenase subunit 1
VPFIPHTIDDVSSMLATLGMRSLEDLFDEIPEELRVSALDNIPAALSEMEAAQLMRERAARDEGGVCFMGAGAYDHHIPAPVWEIVTRGEYYSAYTPYQAEASQGTLQVAYEFQTMIANLTGLDVSNASLYDGASALAEAVLMAVRLHRKSKRILMPANVHPAYRAVVRTIVSNQGIEVVSVPFDSRGGQIAVDTLPHYEDEPFAALVIPQPNFFGTLEEVDALTAWGHRHGMFVIGLVNPVALALLSPPGEWGDTGADIACGEGQPLGVPLSCGGPYFGFMACKRTYVRQMPGRIVGRTVDLDGRSGFTLTMQAREQHIRRAKATSNICTNQGLLVTAATIHVTLLGAEGLSRVARTCHHSCASLLQTLTSIEGVERVFERPFFHEAVVRLEAPVHEVLRSLAAHNVLGGVDLTPHYPELENSMLICSTETRTAQDIAYYADLLARIMRQRAAPKCSVQPKM